MKKLSNKLFRKVQRLFAKSYYVAEDWGVDGDKFIVTYINMIEGSDIKTITITYQCGLMCEVKISTSNGDTKILRR